MKLGRNWEPGLSGKLPSIDLARRVEFKLLASDTFIFSPETPPLKSHTKYILVLIVGWGFILLGIVGLFLPILQGVLFIMIGLIILSSEYVWAHHLLTKVKERFPRLGRTADAAAEKAATWLQRLSGQRKTGKTD